MAELKVLPVEIADISGETVVVAAKNQWRERRFIGVNCTGVAPQSGLDNVRPAFVVELPEVALRTVDGIVGWHAVSPNSSVVGIPRNMLRPQLDVALTVLASAVQDRKLLALDDDLHGILRHAVNDARFSAPAARVQQALKDGVISFGGLS